MDGMTSPVNVFEVIRHRRSVRTFDGKPLAANDADRILEFASKTENPFDIPIEWKLLDAKKEVFARHRGGGYLYRGQNAACPPCGRGIRLYL